LTGRFADSSRARTRARRATMTSKGMDSTATELRQAIAAAKGGRRNAHVPEDLRKRALELLEAGRARGTKVRSTAAALGIHETTLWNWHRDAGARTAFVRARVVADREPAGRGEEPGRGLRVVVIDGLDAAGLGELLRGLS
jgi:DNA invertase Pin-like site-specific DNA recombinase